MLYWAMLRPSTPSPRSARGFSLLELIVVLAILIILTTLMSRQLSGTHRRNALEQCRKNLQEIFLANTIYADDHQGSFPLLASARNSAEPLSLLVPRCTTETAMFTCPGSGDKALPEGEPFTQRRISYAYYMGRKTNDASMDVLLSDWQVDSLPKRAGQLLFSADGQKPGNNHEKDGGNILLVNGTVERSGPKAQRDWPVPPGVTLLNPAP
jgi:prepilin-type N-terminal cleavage/methylation domain-containing protein